MKTVIKHDIHGNAYEFHIAETHGEREAASKRMNADPDHYDGFSGYRAREEERAKAKKEKEQKK